MLIKHTAPASVVDEMALDAVLAESGLTENNQAPKSYYAGVGNSGRGRSKRFGAASSPDRTNNSGRGRSQSSTSSKSI